MKKAFKIIGRIGLILLAVIIALPFLIWGGLNIAKFAIYSEYYSIESDICKNPGLSDGFVCQGIAVSEDDGRIFVSGYMKDDSPSRIYVTDFDSNSYYVTLLNEKGEDFTGHAGGVAVTGDTVYVANGGKIYFVEKSSLLNAENGDSVTIKVAAKLNSSASFVFTDKNYLYVGEFHDGGKYVTEHPYETADGTYHAIISRFDINDLSKPDKIYSIRNKVQGAAFTPDGKVVLSTSYGLSDTVYYIYNESDATDSGLTLDGVPVYFLDKCEKEIKGPAMGEDLDCFDGKIITLTESASDKYLFGKFFFANKIVALDIDQLS